MTCTPHTVHVEGKWCPLESKPRHPFNPTGSGWREKIRKRSENFGSLWFSPRRPLLHTRRKRTNLLSSAKRIPTYFTYFTSTRKKIGIFWKEKGKGYFREFRFFPILWLDILLTNWRHAIENNTVALNRKKGTKWLSIPRRQIEINN